MSVTKFTDSYWLAPWEQERACEVMARYDLWKYSNKRDLPLKSGGFTDVYVNLRDTRIHPEAIRPLARLFANPLRRLQPDVFIDVPDSLSDVVGVVASETSIPHITVREEAKEGRVAKARMIGEARYGHMGWIIDDVITDGASKLPAYNECLKAGLKVPGIVVLVDRQQGWEKKFQEQNIPLTVWPGMTLHHVRKFLIGQGLMERCDPRLEEKNPIILALDGRSWKEVLPVIDPLRTVGCILKVNDLMIGEGLGIVSDLHVYGRVLLDLKGHDIPNTLQNISNRILRLPVLPWGVIVHASGGTEMLQAVVQAFQGTSVSVFAVTVLTSLKEECQEIYCRLPIEQVRVLAKIADKAGVHGFICSPEEVKELSTTYPNKICITPGVRSPGVDAADQKRTDTPAAAWANGARRLVMGRQILNAPDPPAEVKRVLTEELGVNI